MPSSIPPSERPAPVPNPARSRPLPFDRIVILLLGACGCVLSFDSLRQVALAIHVRPDLSYLFPIVIDGFIAYGVRAILLLHEAPRGARLYAWTLFGAATAASLWANSLHAVRLNSPGAHVLILGNDTVAVLSTIAPMALGGATHLHILVSRHVRPHRPESAAAGTPSPDPVVPAPIPTLGPVDSQADTRQVPTDGPAAETTDRLAADPAPALRNGRTEPRRSRPRTGTGRPGRPADATIDELASVIARAHPDASRLSRAAAREAIQAAGLSAGNERIAQALSHLVQDQAARPEPTAD
jgi:hypothetical protein